MLTNVLPVIPESQSVLSDERVVRRPVDSILRSLLNRKMHVEDAWQRHIEAVAAEGANQKLQQVEEPGADSQRADDEFVDITGDQDSSPHVSGMSSDSPEGSLRGDPAGAPHAGNSSAASASVEAGDIQNAAGSNARTQLAPRPASSSSAWQGAARNSHAHRDSLETQDGSDSRALVGTGGSAASSTAAWQSTSVGEESTGIGNGHGHISAGGLQQAHDNSSSNRRDVKRSAGSRQSPEASTSGYSRVSIAMRQATTEVASSSGSSRAGGTLATTQNAATSSGRPDNLPPQAVLQLLTDVVLEQARDLRRLNARVDAFVKQQAKAAADERDAKLQRQREWLAGDRRGGQQRRRGRRRGTGRKVLGVLLFGAALLFWAHRR